ncbi:MAG: protease modulator HflC [Pseudomonadota bacterium]|nr:protease modulator HflC [Pseudomonadota bacterium]
MLGAKIIVSLVLIAIIGWFSLFTVDQREYAILFRFQEIQRSDYEPGLHFMIPVVNTVLKFPKRLMYLESEPLRFLTKEKKDVIVDSFVKWKIEDVETFYKRTRGDETIARELLFQQINDSLRGEFGKRTVQEVVAGHRGDVTKIVTATVREKGFGLGVRVVDVRTKRINLPEEVSSAVYDRMRAERQRAARQLRSEGAEAAERIRAAADRDRTVILAEAYREAEQTRGEGDAKSAETYAGGYGRNEEFYSFYRSLNAYKKSFGKNQDILLLDPTSDFFNYFKSPASP